MSINIRHDSVYREVLIHLALHTACWIKVPWMRVSTVAPALWAGRVVMQAVVTFQVGDVWVRRVRVRHVAGCGTEVMWGGRRSVQIVPMHLQTETSQVIWRGSSTRVSYPCQGGTALFNRNTLLLVLKLLKICFLQENQIVNFKTVPPGNKTKWKIIFTEKYLLCYLFKQLFH